METNSSNPLHAWCMWQTWWEGTSLVWHAWFQKCRKWHKTLSSCAVCHLIVAINIKNWTTCHRSIDVTCESVPCCLKLTSETQLFRWVFKMQWWMAKRSGNGFVTDETCCKQKQWQNSSLWRVAKNNRALKHTSKHMCWLIAKSIVPNAETLWLQFAEFCETGKHPIGQWIVQSRAFCICFRFLFFCGWSRGVMLDQTARVCITEKDLCSKNTMILHKRKQVFNCQTQGSPQPAFSK